MDKIKLFCIPHAGSSALMYNQWKRFLNPQIELIPLELSGRGKRSGEDFYLNFEEALDDLYSKVENIIEDNQYAFFGHSMGSLLAYELTCRIADRNKTLPLHLLLSGRYPPHIKKGNNNVHLLEEDKFINEVAKYDGIPQAILKDESHMKYFLAILRADYRVIESHVKHEIKCLDCGFTVLYGTKDSSVTRDEMCSWQNYTGKSFEVIEFPCGHFYTSDYNERLVEHINRIVLEAAITK